MDTDRSVEVTAPRGLYATGFWTLYDVALLALAVLAASEALNRFAIGSVVWYAVYASTLLRIAMSWRWFVLVLKDNISLLFYPAICLCSVLWSTDRDVSLISGIQLAMTILIGLYLGAQLSPRSICYVIFWVIVATVVLSLINWQTGLFGRIYAPSGGMTGIYSHKNALGQRAMVGILAAVALILYEPRRSLTAAALAGGAALCLLALLLSQSITPLLLLPILILGLVLLSPASARWLWGWALLAGLVAAAMVPLLLLAANLDIIAYILEKVGKDATLTGRTLLWDIAFEALRNNWIFGVGYMAFWRAPEFQHYALLALSIGGDTTFAFHNVLLEVWVASGLFGLASMLVFLFSSTIRSWSYWAKGGELAGFALVCIVGSFGLAMLGPSLFRQHEFSILLIATLGCVMGRLDTWKKHAARGALISISSSSTSGDVFERGH